MSYHVLQESLKSVYFSLGGTSEIVRETNDLNTILAEIAALDLGEKIAHGGDKPDTGVVTLTPGQLARNVDGVVTLDFSSPFVSVASSPGQYKTLKGAKLPAEYRPIAKVRMPISIGGNFAELVINPDGNIQQVAPVEIAAGTDLRGTITYTR